MNDLIILLIILIGISIMFLIVISLKKLDDNSEINSKLKNNDFIYIGNAFVLLILIGLFNIESLNYISKLGLSKPLSVLITLLLANIIVAIFGVLPILTLSENKTEKVTLFLKPIILLFTYLFIPFSSLYTLIKKIVYKPVATKMTEDEFLDIIDKAELEDGINQHEKELINKVLEFDDLKVLDIFTPRTDIVAVEESATNSEIRQAFKKSGFSRLPVYTKSIDKIIGTINHKDFYNDILYEKKPLETIITKPVEVTEYMAAKNLLTLLKKNKSHMAIVKDEFGGTLGLITMEDLLEELVGDIFDEHDKVSISVKNITDNKISVLGSTYLEELDELIENIDLSDLEEEDYLTVNGWVLATLGKMGKPGDSFKYKNLNIEVKKSNNKMVLEVEITILPTQ